MKKIYKTIMVIAMVSVAMVANATVRTVSNLGGAQYSTFISAYAVAVNGDTLMVEGSATVYQWGNLEGGYWAKSLVVIGAGINANKQNFVTTQFGYLGDNATFCFAAGASGSRFFGITFTTQVTPVGISDIQFEDCNFQSTVGANGQNMINWSFKNCVISGVIFQNSTATNVFFTNCIVKGALYYETCSISNVVIDHCIFLRPSYYFFDNNGSPSNCPRNTTVKNSIFANAATLFYCNGGGMSFVNCVSANNYSTSGIYYDPGLTFTNFTLGNGWSTSDNYNITGDAAITGMADDGTDIGIHGGASNFSEKGEPLNVDIIRTLNVLNTAAPNGTLNVNITAGKPTDH